MELFAADLIERFYTALWPFLRIGAMLIAVPVLSIDAVSVRIRIILTLALTLMIYPLVEWPTIDPVSAAGLSEIINQILIGALMGFFLQIVTAAVVVGGQAVANSMGLSMATMVDPGLGTVPLVSQFLLILATLIFLAVGGHMLIIGILLRSFETFPCGGSFYRRSKFFGSSRVERHDFPWRGLNCPSDYGGTPSSQYGSWGNYSGRTKFEYFCGRFSSVLLDRLCCPNSIDGWDRCAHPVALDGRD